MSGFVRAIVRTSLFACALAACSAGGGNPVPYEPSTQDPSAAPAPASGPSDDRTTNAADLDAGAPEWDGAPYYDPDAQACVTTIDDARNPCAETYDEMTATPHSAIGNGETMGYGQCGVYLTWYDYTPDAVRRCFYSSVVRQLLGWQRWSPDRTYCGESRVLQAGEVPEGCGPPAAPSIPDGGAPIPP